MRFRDWKIKASIMNVYRVIMAIYVNLSFIIVWRCDFVRYKEAPLLQDAVSLEY